MVPVSWLLGKNKPLQSQSQTVAASHNAISVHSQHHHSRQASQRAERLREGAVQHVAGKVQSPVVTIADSVTNYHHCNNQNHHSPQASQRAERLWDGANQVVPAEIKAAAAPPSHPASGRSTKRGPARITIIAVLLRQQHCGPASHAHDSVRAGHTGPATGVAGAPALGEVPAVPAGACVQIVQRSHLIRRHSRGRRSSHGHGRDEHQHGRGARLSHQVACRVSSLLVRWLWLRRLPPSPSLLVSSLLLSCFACDVSAGCACGEQRVSASHAVEFNHVCAKG